MGKRQTDAKVHS